MAQIIKHRRGSIGQLKDVTAKVGELVMATGSISDLNGPFIFIGETENAAGGYRAVSKLYSGNAAPTISNVAYGTVLDGTPFYAAGNETLYILSSGGNTALDLTGNIEGNTISGVTINNLASTNVSASFFTGSFKGDGTDLFNIPASGVTGLNLSRIASGAFTASISDTGGFQVNTDASISGALNVDGSLVVTGSSTLSGNTYTQDIHGLGGEYLILHSDQYVQLQYDGPGTSSFLWVDENGISAEGNVSVTGSMKVTGDVTVEQDLYVSGNIYQTGSFYTQGNIVLSGSINIGDNLTGDTINFGGEVNSNILPTTGSTYDLGSSGKTWNNIWAENANFTNISLNSIAFDGLTEGRVVTVGNSGSLVDHSGFTFDGTNLNVSGAIEVTNIQGTGSLYLQPDKTDSRLFEIYNTSSGDVHLKGIADYSFFGDDTNYLQINNLSNEITLQSNNQLNLKSQNSSVYLESNDGTIYLNDDSGNNVRMGGDTYINDNLYVNRIYDDNDNNNYLQLDGWNTDDGYWWEGGDGNDTTLLNNTNNANVNILQTNNGNVNIDATNGSVNIHSQNGMNITGSLTVSDGAGVFNSSLIANNSNLTLDNGSNIEMNQGHIYFNNGCGDIYYDTNDNELTLFNDCGNIRLRNNTYTSNNMYFDDGNTLYVNNIGDYDGDGLDIDTDGSINLHSNSSRQINLSVDNAESGTNELHVNNDGVNFSTYDFTSNLTHKVLLDNTGSLKLENVSLSLTGSLGVSGSLDVYGPTHIHNDLYVSGNLAILGSGSIVHISASQVDIGTNIINLNTFAPFERFAGLAVYDSGSNAGVTGSLLWDSTNDVWIYANPSGSNYASARLISGPLNTGSLGDETALTNGHFPIATGDDHISDSLLTYQGTTLALNTNKFTVDSESGDTLISGNFTIEGVGGVDNGNYTSYIVFRNDDDVLGFVGTNDTTNVTDRLLGYNSSTGVLEFSSLIDGGTY